MDEKSVDDKLLDVGSTLRLDDKISIVFLLSSQPDVSLHILRELISSNSKDEENGLFRQFILQLKVSTNNMSTFLNSFVEALVIIKNYRACRLLGYLRRDVFDSCFVGNVNQVRKHLYLLADSLTEKETCDLISHVNGTEVENWRYLEEAMLDWQIKGVVNVGTDLDSSSLETIEKYINCNKEESNYEDSDIVIASQKQIDTYKIVDPTELGFCVVINNETFTRNNDLVELMPTHMLPARPGSERDVQRVEEVFSWLKFRVCIHENVTYVDLRKLLATYAASVSSNHSFIVLVFMSHGTEDVVYTSDSVPISVDALEMSFQRNSCPQLTGKPKILIIQACQGSDFQRVMFDSGCNPKLLDHLALGPERGDALIAWSTVKGYVSFRDRVEGSWFIQELCKELRASAAARDLVEIVTLVNNNLRNKTLHGMFIVPSLSLSLCKKIKLLN